MHKITSSVKTGGVFIFLLVFALSFIVASTDNFAGLTITVGNTEDVSCFSADDGSIQISVTGGNGNYSYDWTGPSTFSSIDQNILNLAAGSYTINVTDTNGNSGSTTVTITQPDLLEISGSQKTDITCNNAADGTITAGTVSGGNANYEYSIGNNTWQTSTSFTGLTPGTYTLTVRDDKGCEDSETISIAQPDVLTISGSTTTPVSCNGGSDGTATAGTISGGNSTFQYSIDGGTFGSASTFSALTAGSHTITVRDNKGCEDSETITVTEPDVLTISQSTTTPVSCNGGSDGTATVGSVSGGNSTFQYSIDGGTFGSASTFSGLTAGSHTITVRDNKGCEASETITVTQPDVLTISQSTTTPVSCNGGSDGTATAGTISGGNTTFQYSIDGGAFGTTTTFSGLNAGSHTIAVRDDKGCEATETITINQPDLLVISGSQKTDISCYNAADGTITVGTVSGGNSNYQYSIGNNTWQTSTSFTGLTPGTYTLRVRDDKGCEAQDAPITIVQPAELVINNTDFSKPTCKGNKDASIISIDVTGGTSGYQYKVDDSNYQNGKNFNGLAGGDHTIYVKDANECVAIKTITIDEPEALALSGSTIIEPLCNGNSNGQIIAGNATGGTPPYEYKVQGRSYQTSQTFSNFSNGTFTVTVQDASGCTATESVTITEPDPLTVNSSQFSEPDCNGENTGEIIVGSASGGTTPYQYKISGRNFQASNTFADITVGSYTITVMDSNNCEITQSITVTQPDVLTISGSTTNPVSCNGGSDGTATAGTISGGNSTFQYSIDGGTFGSATTFSGLNAGSHTITVRDDKGCEASETITVTQPDVLTISGSTATPVSCNGGSDGTASVGTISGGNSTFQYSINGGAFGSANTFSGLQAGSHTITVKDNKGCEASETITINQPDVLTISGSTTTPVSCNGGSDGTATAGNISGGNSTFQYSIDGGAFGTAATFSGLQAGSHTINVRDNKGCEASETITITEPDVLTISGSTTTPVSCNGGSDGTASAGSISGGNSTFQYSIDGGTFASSTSFSGLEAGPHTITVKDNKGCEASETITITEPTALNMTEPSSTAVTCFGGADGSITVGTMSGGNGNYQYSLDNTNFTTSTTFSNLTAGNYTIFVKDQKGCALQKSISVSQPEELNATISKTNVSCYDGSDGSITLSQASGGHGNYEYSIDGSSWQSEVVIQNLSAGSYPVLIRDADYPECEITLSSSIDITQPANPLTATVSKTRTTSYNTSTGTATANGAGGTPGYTYEWRNAGGTNVLQQTKTATNLPAGDYELTIIDSKGCSYQVEFSIIEIIDATIVPTSICSDNEEELIRTSYFEVDDLTARGGVGPYTYQWDFGQDSTPSTATGAGSHQVKYSTTGNKNITLIVTDSENISKEFNYTQFVGECYRDNCGSNDFIGSGYYVGDAEGNPATTASCTDGSLKYIHMTLSSGTDRYSLYAEITYTILNVFTGESETVTENGCFYENEIVPNEVRTIQVPWECGYVITVDRIYLTFSNNIKWSCGQGPNPKCFSTNNSETVVSPLYATATPNELLCFGDEFGTIDVKASGGKAPYQYSITSATSGFQPESNFNNLSAGDYDVWVKDYDGQIYQIPTITITQPDNPITLDTSAQNPTCFGGEGEASVTASGGTPFESGEPYQYLWNDALEQTTATATGLSAGEYTITVIDANGCQAIQTVTVTEPEELTVAETGEDQVFGCGYNTTNLDANTAEKGIGNWTIISGTGGAILDPTDPNSEFTGDNDTYTLRWTIAHADGSCSTTSDMTVTFASDCNTLDFDGIDDHVSFGDNYPMTSGGFSFEVWVKPNSTSGVRTILSKKDYSNPNTGGFDLVINNGAPTFRWGSNSVTTSSKISTDRWYHIAVTYTNSKIELYVDGIRVGTSSASNPSSTTAKFLVGAVYDSSNPDVPQNYFHGWIEELRIWKKGLTEKQIRFMMNQRIKLADGASASTLIEGEIIPNKAISGSYYTNNGLNLDEDGVPFYNLTWGDLSGYYRLISFTPDPSNYLSFDASLKPSGGSTPDLALNSIPGKLYNIDTDQQNTAPLPYISGDNNSWRVRSTWLRPSVWDVPNAIGINGNYINWNIAKVNHNIYSTSQDIDLLGLISQSGELLVNGNVPNETGQGLTITHYLKLDGTINLEGNSQLVQTEGSILDEASSGYIDIDQQGTANSFNYNYWTSPVSLIGTSNNSGYRINEVLLDGTNPNSPQQLSFNYQYHWADGNYSGAKRISSYWLYTFQGTADDYFEWHNFGEAELLSPGIGYSMKGTQGYVPLTDRQNYTFRGKPNNGDITVSVGVDQNLLTGNPYPSAIDAQQFISDNLSDFNGSVYFWDHFGEENTHYLERYIGGYAVYNLSGGVASATSIDSRINATGDKSSETPPGQYIPVGQAFFINTIGVSSPNSITFKNKYRAFVPESTGDSQFHMQESSSPKKGQSKDSKYATDTRYKIRLKFESPKGYHRQILVTADVNTTSGFDLGYDAPLIENNIEDMYWMIDETEFVIQGVPNFNLDQVLPIGIKISETGEYTIKVDELENIKTSFNVYLRDNLNDTYYNLTEKPYKTSAEEIGSFNGRYDIVFKNPLTQNPEEEKPTLEEDTILGLQYFKDTDEISLFNPELRYVDQVELFSISGQLIKTFDDVPTEEAVLLSVNQKLSSAVYIVKVYSSGKIYSEKVIITR